MWRGTLNALWPLATVVCLLGMPPAHAQQRPTGPNPSESEPDLTGLVFEGQARQYLLRLPQRQPEGSNGWPLVMVFHGGGGDAFNAERMTGFTELGRQAGFAVLYPQGTPATGQRLATWNAEHCCGTAMHQRVKDTGFVMAVLDDVQRRHAIDSKRVYATGLSNGGMMVHRVAAAHPDRWAAIAPVIATLFGDEARPALPVPALMVNGELDASVPVDGGAPSGRFRRSWSGTPLLPVSSQGQFWARAGGCHASAIQQVASSHVLWRYNCPTGIDVERVLVTGVGHAWPGGQRGGPGGDDPGTTYNATKEIWRFFERHRRP